jgi:hypothetical protein
LSKVGQGVKVLNLNDLRKLGRERPRQRGREGLAP